MERVRTLIRAAGLAPAVLALAVGTGCVSVDSTAKTMKVSLPTTEAAKPAPATQLICFWQRRLAPLPDPTRDGQQVLGLPGQMFLVGQKEAAAEVDGDLAVMVYDESPRPPGTAPRTPEMWHFTKDTLKRLATNDERFGRSYALYLPWPPAWRDVTAVKIMARYGTPGKPDLDLFAGEQKITLDSSAPGTPVWTDLRAGLDGGPGLPPPAGFDSRSVPDPQRVLQQMRTNGPGYPAGGGVVQAGGFAPPASPGRPAATAPAGGVQPIIIPTRGGL